MTVFSTLKLSVAVCALAALPVFAQDIDTPLTLEQVEEAYHAEDFETARAGLEPLATAGNPKAAYRLGFMIANGMGGPFDKEQSIKWLEAGLMGGHPHGYVLLARLYLSDSPEVPHYERAAELLQIAVDDENVEAHFYLGQLYRIGRGVEGDQERAFGLLRIAARAGHPASAFAIAQMYSRGSGVTADDTQSARWLLESAELGYGEAQMSLYHNYSRGTGFPKDETVALAWLTEAAKSGVPLAQRVLGTSLLLGTDENITADPEQGIALLTAAGLAGEAGAQSNLGYAYSSGTGVEPNMQTAIQWYTRAADQGLIRAALALGEIYRKGEGVDPDFELAFKYLLIAAREGEPNAMTRLGEMWLAEQIVEENLERQFLWISAAAESGNLEAREWLEKQSIMEPYAALRLGMIFKDGIGTDADPDAAAQYMLKAARADFVLAQEAMAELFASGSGVEQDFVQAHKWANVAAANGSETALERRNVLVNLMTPDQVAEAQELAKAFLASQ